MSGGMIVIKHNAGAPLGGRVHWFLYYLEPIVKRAYLSVTIGTFWYF